MQGRQIIHDPERASLGCNEQILPEHLDVVDRYDGHVQLKGLPVGAVVKRDEHPELSAGVQQSLAVRVLAYDTRRIVAADPVRAGRQARPALAVIVGSIDVRLEIAEEIAIDRVVGGASATRRGLDHRHATTGREILWRDVGPRHPVVA